MSSSINVRKATLDDIEAVADLYMENSNPRWTNLTSQGMRDGIRELVSDPGKGYQVVVEAEGIIVGLLRVAPEWSPYRQSTFWWVENVYVIPEWRRKGIYTRMHEFIYEAARQDRSICGIRLYTDEDNYGARKTYVKVGMLGHMTEQFEIDFVFGPHKRD